MDCSVAVSFYSLRYQKFSILLVLIAQIAEKERTRKTKFSETLDFMSQQLEQLEIIDNLSADVGKHESIVNRGLDIRSACMVYLGIHIHHAATPLENFGEFRFAIFFNAAGKVIKIFLIGDEEISDSEAHLQKAIENYTRTLSTIHARVSIKVLDIVEGTISGRFKVTNVHCRNS